MMNFAIGTNVFELNVNDAVFVKTGFYSERTGYFGIIKNIEYVRYYECCTEQPRNVRKINIYSPSDRSTHTFFATSVFDTCKGITKIPKDLCGRYAVFRGDLVTVIYVDIYHKPYCIKVLNEKTGLDEWVTLDKFFELDWSEDEVQKVKAAEMLKEFENKTYYEMASIRNVKIISMCYRSDFENLEEGDSIVLKDIITLDGEVRLRLMRVDYKDNDGKFNFIEHNGYTLKLTNHMLHSQLGYEFLKIPNDVIVGNTLWYNGNPAIIVKTPVLMYDDYMFSIEVFETAIKHHEVPVNAENYHKCVWNNADNKLKETEKALKGVEFNMNMPFSFDEIREYYKHRLIFNDPYSLLSRPENNIVIRTDGIKVTYARCGDLIATSRCHDDDKFDAWTGAKIALERLEKKFIEKAEREKKEKLLNTWYDSLTEEKKEFVKKKLQEEK